MHAIDLNGYELQAAGPGLRVSFPFHSATGTASTATVLFELDPGAELPVHTDSAEELLIILQGTGEARVGDETGRVEKGQVALVPPMAPHGLRNVFVLPRKLVPPVCFRNAGSATEPPWRVSEYAATT